MSSLEISYGVMSLPRFSFAILAWWSRTHFLQSTVHSLQSAARTLPLPRFMEYVTTWYRAPELWDAKGQAASLQALLAPAIDMWSYGCVVFEALMKTLDHRCSLKNTLAEWCKGYPELVARKGPRSQYSSSIIARWAVNLQTCSSLKALVLCACAPNAKSRTWT